MAKQQGKKKRNKNKKKAVQKTAVNAVDTKDTDRVASPAKAGKSSEANTTKPQARSATVKSGSKSGGKTRRNFIKLGVLLVGGGAAAASLHAYDRKKTRNHDLSVIGNGTPAIIQMHDPGCPTCRRLKGAVEQTMKGVDTVNVRIADLSTKKGREFQTRYNYPKTTLLFFDADGKHRHTMSGVQTPEAIKNAIRVHIQPDLS